MPIEKNLIFNRLQTTGVQDTIVKNLPFHTMIPGGNYWISRQTLGTARSTTGRFEIDGYLYISTGLTSGSGRTAVTERYNDSTNTWANRTNFNQSAPSAGGSFKLSLGYIGYGINSGNVNGSDMSILSGYNEVADSWTTKTSGSVARRAVATFTLNSYGYVVRGIVNVSGATWKSDNERFDETTNTWATKTSAAQAADASSGFSLGVYGFCSHGRTAAGSYINTSVRYNDVTDTWTTMSSASGTARMPTSGMVLSDLAYAVGGYSGADSALNDQYDYTIDSWTVKAPNLTALEAPCTGSLNGTGYACGGDLSANGTGLNNVSQYKNYHLNFLNFTFKRSAKAPRSISVFTLLDNKAIRLPIQIRTDGSTWRPAMSGLNSAAKSGDVLSTVYAAAASGYRSYEIAVGIPPQIGSNSAGFWLTKASLIAGNDEPAPFAIGGYGYMAGGEEGGTVSRLQRYDDFADTWTAFQSLGSARSGQAGVSLNGSGYSFSGSSSGLPAGIITTCDRYNQETNTWTSVQAITSAVFLPSPQTMNGYGYVVGGADSGSTSRNTNQQYNDVTNTWAAKAVFPTIYRAGGNFTINGLGYISHGEATGGSNVATSAAYNDGGDVWITRASGTTAREQLASFSINERGLIACGTTGSVSNRTDEFMEPLNLYLVRTVNPQARTRIPGIGYNGVGYVCGGTTGSVVSTVHQYKMDISVQMLTVNLIVDEG